MIPPGTITDFGEGSFTFYLTSTGETGITIEYDVDYNHSFMSEQSTGYYAGHEIIIVQ